MATPDVSPVSISGSSPDLHSKSPSAATLSAPKEEDLKKRMGALAKEGESLGSAIEAAGDDPEDSLKERLKKQIEAYEDKWKEMSDEMASYKKNHGGGGADAQFLTMINLMLIALKHGRGHLFEPQGWVDMKEAAINAAREGAVAGIEAGEDALETAKDVGSVVGNAASKVGNVVADGAAYLGAAIKKAAQSIGEACSSKQENLDSSIKINDTPAPPSSISRP